MANNAFTKLQADTGLSNGAIAHAFEIDLSTVGRWKSGAVKCPKPVILCLKSTRDNKPVIMRQV